MKAHHVRFVWSPSRVARSRWHLGLFGFGARENGRARTLVISVRGLGAWSGALLAVAYFVLTAALSWAWQRNPYSVLTYRDALLYPVRRDEVSEKKGRAFLAEGMDLLRAKKPAEATRYLQLGLARCRDFRARLALAQIYAFTNQRPRALRLLQEGLTDEFPGRAYLDALFNAAEQGEDHELVFRTARRYAAPSAAALSLADQRWLTERAFGAALAAGLAEEALAVAENEPVGDTSSEHRLLALLALRRIDEAVTLGCAWRDRPGADAATAARLQVRAFREAQQFAQMEAALKDLRSLLPGEPEPLVYGIVQQALAGRDAAAAAALADYLFRFGGQREHLTILARALAEIGALPLLERCVEAAAERGYPHQSFEMLLIQAHARRGEWEKAMQMLAAMAPATGRQAAGTQIWREWMAVVLDAARQPAESSQLAVRAFVREHRCPIQVFRDTLEIIWRADRLDTAREVAAAGLQVYPASKWLQAQSADIAAQLSVRAAAAAAVAAQSPRPIPARPIPSAAEEASDYLAQVKLRQEQGDMLAMLTAARVYLNGDRARTDRLLLLAKEYLEQGDKSSTAALAREVLRRTPNFPPAQRLLAVAEPAPAQ